jgi:hypothetical protein
MTHDQHRRVEFVDRPAGRCGVIDNRRQRQLYGNHVVPSVLEDRDNFAPARPVGIRPVDQHNVHSHFPLLMFSVSDKQSRDPRALVQALDEFLDLVVFLIENNREKSHLRPRLG